MTPLLRPGTPADAAACGAICYHAFRTIAERHAFPPDFPSVETATAFVGAMLAHPGFHAVVAELDGRVVGSNFLDERSAIAGVGPITVDPSAQDRSIGSRLMRHVLARAEERAAPGVRLVQAAYHTRSLSLYTKLGFVVREPLVVLQGTPPGAAGAPAGRAVRRATDADVAACDALCRRVHGHDRHGELVDAVRHGVATVVEHEGRVSGYATGVGFVSHAVGERDEDVAALVAAAPAVGGPGLLLPARNAALFTWALRHGLRVVQVMTLMTMGFWEEPRGAYLPSVLY
jgi:predicted N-acetyltransferase YhbS